MTPEESVAMPDESDIMHIALMGATGSGKSTFINLVSGSRFKVSHKLNSCTEEVAITAPFDLDGRKVHLIDTPGFDDTTRSDVDILNCISAFLANQFQVGIKLHGIIYLHRISDTRFSGISVRSFRLFRSLCGEKTLRNAMIVTTMWDKVPENEAEEREEQLKTDRKFFKPALDEGAGMLRHNNSLTSAQNVIRTIFQNHPLPLAIQEEIVNQKKDITQTEAGRILRSELEEIVEKYEKEIRDLRKELEETAAHDKNMIQRLEQELQKSESLCEKIRNDMDGMSRKFREENERIQKELERVKAVIGDEHIGAPPVYSWRTLSEESFSTTTTAIPSDRRNSADDIHPTAPELSTSPLPDLRKKPLVEKDDRKRTTIHPVGVMSTAKVSHPTDEENTPQSKHKGIPKSKLKRPKPSLGHKIFHAFLHIKSG